MPKNWEHRDRKLSKRLKKKPRDKTVEKAIQDLDKKYNGEK